jgi:hypothetical protein
MWMQQLVTPHCVPNWDSLLDPWTHLATNLATLHTTNGLLLVGCSSRGGQGTARQGQVNDLLEG